jgi:F-type H+-transporting ATPase subunit a
MVNTWIIMAILIAFAIIVRSKLTNFKERPTGFQNVVEFIVETFNGYVRSTVGRRMFFLAPWFFTVFLFLVLANISGMFFLRPPTADWTATFPLAFVTFLLITTMSLKFNPKSYIKGLFDPIFLFLPINIIGELARPVSLSFRLFGNILGGVILISIVYGMAPIFVQLFVPLILHAYFDLAMGLLHAYVFVTLSMSFINAIVGLDED